MGYNWAQISKNTKISQNVFSRFFLKYFVITGNQKKVKIYIYFFQYDFDYAQRMDVSMFLGTKFTC